MIVVSRLSGKFVQSVPSLFGQSKSAKVIVCSLRGIRTSKVLSGGHSPLFVKRPGQLLHNRYKDHAHFYLVAIGVWPCLLVIVLTHIFYGSCELQDYPEDGTVPHHWQFERTPLRQWYKKWIGVSDVEHHERQMALWEKWSIVKRWRRMEMRVKHLQGERWDYKGYYYKPVSAAWIEYAKYKRDKIAATNEYRGHLFD